MATTQNETKAEMVARVRQMATDDGGTWDLSENDGRALTAVLADRDALLAVVRDIDKWARESEGQARLYRFEFDSPVGIQLRAAIAQAEGRS